MKTIALAFMTVAISQQLLAEFGLYKIDGNYGVKWSEPISGSCMYADVIPHQKGDRAHDNYARLAAQCRKETVGKYTWSYVTNGDNAVIVNAEVIGDDPEKGSAILTTAISPKPTGALTIPSTLGGKPVTEIAVFAFKGCDGITMVKIPDTIQRIAPGTFADCIKLKRFDVDKKNEYYSVVNGFLVNDYKAKQRDITIKKTAKSDADDTPEERRDSSLWLRVLRNEPPDYKLCEVPRSLQKVDLPKGVKYIMPKAFAGCKSLKKVSLPQGVQAIGYQAFAGCDNLEEIEIPQSVEDFVWGAFNYNRSGSWSTYTEHADEQFGLSRGLFSGCPKLKTIKIAKGNTSCSIVNGCLIANNGEVLVKCMVDGEVEIPRSVMVICKGAFSGCAITAFKVADGHEKFCTEDGLLLCKKYSWYLLEKVPNGLQKVRLPNKDILIKGSAFDDCGVLEELTIPKSANVIIGAVTGCSSLKRVIFEGHCKIGERDAFMTREDGEHEVFSGFGENCIVFVSRDSKGYCNWGEVPGTWHGSRMELIPKEGEPWPEIAPKQEDQDASQAQEKTEAKPNAAKKTGKKAKKPGKK